MKSTFAKTRDYTYAYNLEGVDRGFHIKPFGQQLDAKRKIRAFTERSDVKKEHVDSKGKSTLQSVKDWVKKHGPNQFYAQWRSDSEFYKDDSVEIIYI